jgi:hypothetical protein
MLVGHHTQSVQRCYRNLDACMHMRTHKLHQSSRQHPHRPWVLTQAPRVFWKGRMGLTPPPPPPAHTSASMEGGEGR